MAAWAGARKGGGHVSWPSCATVATQGQAEAAKVTAVCAQAGGRIQPVTAVRTSSPGGTFFSWLSLHMGFFLLWLGDTVPMKRLGIVLATQHC